jgi:apolipoprotein N-acyltransferase
MKTEPVLTAAAVAGILMAFFVMAVNLGWLRLDETQMQSIQAFVLPTLGLVLPLAAAWYARGKVTPTASHKTQDGTPAVLVPESDATPTQIAAAQEARK